MKTAVFCVFAVSFCLAVGVRRSTAIGATIDFESPTLAPALFENGVSWPGEFVLEGASFANEYLPAYSSWSGWAVSRDTDTTTAGFLNQYSAWPGAGAGDSLQYGVAYSGLDVAAGIAPVIALPEGALPTSIAIANTTYAVLSMLNGDSFAKKFGGASGLDPDWYRLTIHALDDAEASLATIEFYLADYRPPGTASDFIREGWETIDLTPLRVPGVSALGFRLDSSDVGPFGMNTPAYFAADNFTFETPLPGDFNGDGHVDGADYARWRNSGGSSSDFQNWKNNFNAATAGAVTATASPEPSTLPIAIAAATIAASRRSARIPPR